MQVEVLIHADVKILEDDDIDALREEIIERIRTCISKFAGNVNTKKGMYGYLEDIDHEVAFDDEGNFEWRKKND